MKLIRTIDAACCPPVLSPPLDEAAADRFAAALRVRFPFSAGADDAPSAT